MKRTTTTLLVLATLLPLIVFGKRWSTWRLLAKARRLLYELDDHDFRHELNQYLYKLERLEFMAERIEVLACHLPPGAQQREAANVLRRINRVSRGNGPLRLVSAA